MKPTKEDGVLITPVELPRFGLVRMAVSAAQQAVLDAALAYDEAWRENHRKEYRVAATELSDARAKLSDACAHLRMACEALRNATLDH